MSLYYFVSSLNLTAKRSLGIVVTLILFSLPIPWAHHNATKNIVNLRIADTLKKHVSDELPVFLIWLTAPHDALQDWLIDHHICVRRMEHKLFWQRQVRRYPERTLVVPSYLGEYPVGYFSTVGVPGWVLPNISIIDGYGLSDYVIARHAPYQREERLMAHDRYPPDGYVASFVPNVGADGSAGLLHTQRPPELELSRQKIIDLELYWENKIVHGVEQPDSPPSGP